MPRLDLTIAVSLLLSAAGLRAGCAEHDADLVGRARARPLTRPAGFGGVAYEEFEPASEGGSLADLRRVLPVLAERGVSLSLHWKAERIDDPERFEIVQEAQARGIAVYPVLLLPEGSEVDEDPASPRHAETGYYPNVTA